MVIITVLFLALLFLAGFLNLFFHFPSKKFFAWLQQYFAPKQSSSSSSSSSSSAISSSQASLHKERNGHNKTEFKKVFATFDKNGDGFITKQELKESLKNIRILVTEKEVEEMVLKVDANGDGLIEFDEFCVLCEAMVGQEGTSELGDGSEGIGKEGVEEDLKEAFGVFDKDKDGLISVEELGLVLCSLGLKEGKKVEDCKEMIRKVDMDGDGMVNYDEFKMMMKGGGKLLLAS